MLATYNVVYGLIDSTIGSNSPTSDRCQYRSIQFYQTASTLSTLATNGDITGFLSQITLLLTEVHPITIACKQVTNEYDTSFESYGVSFADYIRIIFNIIYRFGSLYDLTFETITLFSGDLTALTNEEYRNFGSKAGAYFYYTFYDIGDYDRYLLYPYAI